MIHYDGREFITDAELRRYILLKEDKRKQYENNQKPYIYAVRLFLKDRHIPMAELAFGEGGRPNGKTETIRWDVISERERFIINAYTLIFDERVNDGWTFNDYVNWRER